MTGVQMKLKSPSINVREREVLQRDLQTYESNLQTYQRAMPGIETDLTVQRSALRGESCPIIIAI